MPALSPVFACVPLYECMFMHMYFVAVIQYGSREMCQVCLMKSASVILFFGKPCACAHIHLLVCP